VTSAGTSAIDGDLGVSPGTAVTGFGPGTVSNGAVHAGDAVAADAHTDLATAYGVAVARAPATPVSGVLGGETLAPGVYAAGTLALAGTLTLDAQGDPNGVFILQAASTLTSAAGSAVSLAGGAQSCNVFWQVGSSATLGAASSFTGTILAQASISSAGGVAVNGRLLARDGAVTLSDDSVAVSHCAALSNTAPAIAPFDATLTGAAQTVLTTVGAWSVTDPSGTDAGYRVTVAASAATVGGVAADAGTGGSVTLTTRDPVAGAGNPVIQGPVAEGHAQPLTTTATTIATAGLGSGQGIWNFRADSGAEKSLSVVIPGNARAGPYTRTLTFTTAPPAA
jgi:hypothetical protein